MRLYNTIAIFDCFIVAENGEPAREALLSWIRDERMQPSELVAIEVKRKETVRASWQNQNPLVASDISDDDFEAIKGKTTLDVFAHLYEKRG